MADKGVAIVLLNRQDYLNEAHDLHADKDTYRCITGDPTTKHKNKLIQILKTIRVQGGLNATIY